MAFTDRAVVVGAGMGGLLMARALCAAYGDVVVLDRDALPDTPTARRGVPQGRHLHGLLARGIAAIDDLCPGLSADLIARGAPHGDFRQHVLWHHEARPMRQSPLSIPTVAVSRPMLEHAIRQRVTASSPQVRIVPGKTVVGLAASPDRRRVTGVRVLSSSADRAEHTITADLVVDAIGRGSRMPVWLRELGYPPAPEERLDVGITYLTRHYARDAYEPDAFLAVIAPPSPAAAWRLRRCPRGRPVHRDPLRGPR